MEFFRQDTGVGSHSLLPGIEPRSPALQADSYHLSHQGSPIKCLVYTKCFILVLFHPVKQGNTHFADREIEGGCSLVV